MVEVAAVPGSPPGLGPHLLIGEIGTANGLREVERSGDQQPRTVLSTLVSLAA